MKICPKIQNYQKVADVVTLLLLHLFGLLPFFTFKRKIFGFPFQHDEGKWSYTRNDYQKYKNGKQVVF